MHASVLTRPSSLFTGSLGRQQKTKYGPGLSRVIYALQTISAPHMHAAALELLQGHLQPGASAFDVGSGRS